MIIIPQDALCRTCRHFRGVTQPDGTERSETLTCAAFEDHIPAEILLSKFDHRKPHPDDGGIQYEPKSSG